MRLEVASNARVRKTVLTAIVIGLSVVLVASLIHAIAPLDYPHFSLSSISCENCHFAHNTTEQFFNWAQGENQHIDDTVANNLCWSCHNDVIAPLVKTHSSLQIDDDYGDWSMECRKCHWPHQQPQFRTYGEDSYLYSNTSTFINSTTLSRAGAGWTPGQYAGLVVIPNISNVDYNYKIINNTDEENLTVAGGMDLDMVSAGDTFAIVYGKLIHSTISTPNSEDKTVRFFNASGNNSFADGDATYDGPCEVCHTKTTHFNNTGDALDQLHTNMQAIVGGEVNGTACTDCHQHLYGFRPVLSGAHPTHISEPYGPLITCQDGNFGCHGIEEIPLLRNNTDLANTSVCDDCHSSADVDTAKRYWFNPPGSSIGAARSWAVNESYKSFCGSCHDSTRGMADPDLNNTGSSGDFSPNVLGDDSTYGFYVTGHGLLNTSNYSKLAWQELTYTSAAGNPGANRTCSDCHELTSTHFNNPGNRLKSGFENSANNSVCRQCHDQGGQGTVYANKTPLFYTNYSDFQRSAHFSKSTNPYGSFASNKCTTCHDVHGATGAYKAMAKGKIKASSPGDSSNLCYQCHKNPGSGGIKNPGVAGHSTSGTQYGVYDDIQEAFSGSTQTKHDLGHTFTLRDWSGNIGTYNLQCTSCHNVHLVSGRYWDQNQMNVSPVTRPSMPHNPLGNTYVWGDDPEEKMAYYMIKGNRYRADGNPNVIYPGWYQIPGSLTPGLLDFGSGDVDLRDVSFNGSALVDWPTFCLDCHRYDISPRNSTPWLLTSAYGSYINPSGLTIKGKEWGDANTQSVYQTSPGGQYAGGNPHGLKMAGQTSLWQRTCPDNYGCQRRLPVFPQVPRGGGTIAYMRGAYTQDPRRAGWNYVLSCTDCHDPHGANMYSLMRPGLNRNHDGTGMGGNYLYMPNDQNYRYYDWGSQTFGVCYQCHGIQKTKTHNVYHFQTGYCSPCCGTNPNHLTLGAVPVGSENACGGVCHTRWSWRGNDYGDHIRARFHENRRPAGGPNPVVYYDINNNIDSNHDDDYIQYFPFDQRGRGPGQSGENKVMYWFNTLVTWMKFEGNFFNYGPWDLEGSWVSEAPGSASFTTDRFGNPNSAIQVNNKGVMLGATDGLWDGNVNPMNHPHEMKYAGTWEAWINPEAYPPMVPGDPGCWSWNTPDRIIMTNAQSGVNQVFKLRYQTDEEFGSSYRLHLQVTVEEGGPGGSNVYRGAYSNVSIPLNEWTHVAATYNASLYDQDSDNDVRSKGRIRIYVDGEDVTWNRPSENDEDSQPAAGEGEGEYGDDGTGGLETCADPENGCSRRFVIGSHTWWYNCRHFIGKIDEVKVWNIDKGAEYMSRATPPRLKAANGVSGDNFINVNFTKGVYTSVGPSGALVAGDFFYNGSKSVISVNHTAGSSQAILGLDGNLTSIDFYTDTIAPLLNQIYDDYNNPADTTPATIGGDTACPWPVIFFDFTAAPAEATTVTDDSGLMVANINNETESMQGNGYYSNGLWDTLVPASAVTYANIDNTETMGCFYDPRHFTYDVRFKPDDVDTDTDDSHPYGDTDSNFLLFYSYNQGFFQLVRHEYVGDKNPPAGYATPFFRQLGIYNEDDPPIGQWGKSYHERGSECWVTSDHWYTFRIVWDSDYEDFDHGRGIISIYADDEGTDGNHTGEEWAGFKRCDSAEYANQYSPLPGDTAIIKTGTPYGFWIGANKNYDWTFNGTIDWLKWQAYSDYSGVDLPPVISNIYPLDGTNNVSYSSNITLEVNETTTGSSGIDNTSFNITITGDKGYFKEYLYANTSVVSWGSRDTNSLGYDVNYSITVDPDVNFTAGERFTVKVIIRDRNQGGDIVSPAMNYSSVTWTFSTRPKLFSEDFYNETLGAMDIFRNAGQESGQGFEVVLNDELDSNWNWSVALGTHDGDTHYANNSNDPPPPNRKFTVDMENATGIENETNLLVTVFVVAKIVNLSTGLPVNNGNFSYGFRTSDVHTYWYEQDDNNQRCITNTSTMDANGYNTFEHNFEHDSNGDNLDWNTINDAQITIWDENHAADTELRITQIYMEVRLDIEV